MGAGALAVGRGELGPDLERHIQPPADSVECVAPLGAR
jgi:hypothetical protein